MSYEALLLDVEQGVATITLNRPERMNAWNGVMANELNLAMHRCNNDDEVRAVVLTGAGRAFCAGADLSGDGSTFSGRSEDPEEDTRAIEGLLPYQLTKPVIAAVNGAAVGVGITYALSCDMRFVAADAKIAFAFVRRGVIPELSSHVILQRVAGFANAADLLMSGRLILGTEAAEMGLMNKALPRDEVLPAALAYARDLAANAAPVSVAISKKLLWEGIDASVDSMKAREDPLFAWAGNQQDAREGVLSFVEKRRPEWSLSPSNDLPESVR